VDPATAPIRLPRTCLRLMAPPPAGLRHDFPTSQHRVVLVDGVVAVDRIVAEEVSELHEELELAGALRPHGVLPDPRGVFPRDLVDGRTLAVPGQDLVLLQVDV